MEIKGSFKLFDGIFLIKPDGTSVFITNEKITALEFHRLVQKKLDVVNTDEQLSIVDLNATNRLTDDTIILVNNYYLPEESFKWITDGTIS